MKTQTADGGGFDIDGDAQNSFLQYNYAHDNQGEGYLLWTGSFGGEGHTNNIMRFNISENDGTVGSSGSGGFVIQGTTSGGTTDYIYNNTFYSTETYCGYVSGSGTYYITNDIFYCTHSFLSTSIGTWNGNNFYGGVSSVGSNVNTSNPGFSSAGGGGTCYSSGTPGGPQPCPSAYHSTLTTGGQSFSSSTFGATSVSTDYYGNSVSGSSMPIGAYK